MVSFDRQPVQHLDLRTPPFRRRRNGGNIENRGGIDVDREFSVVADGEALQPVGIVARGHGTAEARGATAKPRLADQGPVGLGHVLGPAIGIREKVDRG